MIKLTEQKCPFCRAKGEEDQWEIDLNPGLFLTAPRNIDLVCLLCGFILTFKRNFLKGELQDYVNKELLKRQEIIDETRIKIEESLIEEAEEQKKGFLQKLFSKKR